MFFNTEEIENRHRVLCTPGGTADVMAAAVQSCGRLLVAIANNFHPDQGRRVSIVVALGVRLSNTSIAAGLLVRSGLWAASLHCLRDLAETGQLLRYFELRPEEIEPWADSEGPARYHGYRFGRIHQEIHGHGAPASEWKNRFDAYSNFGTHVSAEGLFLHQASAGELHPTPYDDPAKFKFAHIGLAGDLCTATLQCCTTLDAVQRGEPVSSRLTRQWASVAGAHRILVAASYQQWIDTWR